MAQNFTKKLNQIQINFKEFRCCLATASSEYFLHDMYSHESERKNYTKIHFTHVCNP